MNWFSLVHRVFIKHGSHKYVDPSIHYPTAYLKGQVRGCKWHLSQPALKCVKLSMFLVNILNVCFFVPVEVMKLHPQGSKRFHDQSSKWTDVGECVALPAAACYLLRKQKINKQCQFSIFNCTAVWAKRWQYIINRLMYMDFVILLIILKGSAFCCCNALSANSQTAACAYFFK